VEPERDHTTARGRQAKLERESRFAEAERKSHVTDFVQRVREELTQAVRDSDDLREPLAKAKRRGDLVDLSAPPDAGEAAGGRAIYHARVSLTSTTPDRLNEPLRLLPGMTTTAKVIVGRRTVVSCFRYPLTRVADASIRER
jgi:hypothetical protein